MSFLHIFDSVGNQIITLKLWGFACGDSADFPGFFCRLFRADFSEYRQEYRAARSFLVTSPIYRTRSFIDLDGPKIWLL